MAGEEWARRIVQKELKRKVELNDDGSKPGMYDLRIGLSNEPEVAIECVGAVDQAFTETWNVGPAKGPLDVSVKGDWIITIKAGARVKVIKQRVEQLLQKLEARGIEELRVDYYLRWQDESLFDELTEFGITHASRYRVKGTGKVHLDMPGIGGAVDEQGNSVPEWISTFLRDPAYQDVLSKLQRSGASECHVFVLVSFAGTPWSIASYLTGSLVLTPTQPPDLPAPVSGVWVASGLSQRGLRWDGITWQIFQTRGTDIDE